MKIDLTLELARLLKFTSDVAIAIRMYSAYNQSADYDENAPDDLMWLSDCLHNFDMLGRAVQDRCPANIITACDMLLKNYESYQLENPRSTRQAKPTFDRNISRVSLAEAKMIFREIKAKMQPLLN